MHAHTHWKVLLIIAAYWVPSLKGAKMNQQRARRFRAAQVQLVDSGKYGKRCSVQRKTGAWRNGARTRKASTRLGGLQPENCLNVALSNYIFHYFSIFSPLQSFQRHCENATLRQKAAAYPIEHRARSSIPMLLACIKRLSRRAVTKVEALTRHCPEVITPGTNFLHKMSEVEEKFETLWTIVLLYAYQASEFVVDYSRLPRRQAIRYYIHDRARLTDMINWRAMTCRITASINIVPWCATPGTTLDPLWRKLKFRVILSDATELNM